ncbi:hypothetical protein HUJ05_011089 [Dendroctonus ponderosae]|nr:hypothetical protein HUJ05_011089 [Dendroctonus ponderosae]
MEESVWSLLYIRVVPCNGRSFISRRAPVCLGLCLCLTTAFNVCEMSKRVREGLCNMDNWFIGKVGGCGGGCRRDGEGRRIANGHGSRLEYIGSFGGGPDFYSPGWAPRA